MKQGKISYWFPFAVVLLEIATYLANDMYLPGLPLLMEEFQISQSVAQDTLLYWFLGSASLQLLMGPLSDRFGRKVVLILGVLMFSASSFACAYTSNIHVFLIARFIQGCVVCAVVVAGYAAIHESYDTFVAIKIISLMGAIVILAPAFGPILGALVIEFTDWRAIFYILTGWGLLSLLMLSLATPSRQKEKIPLQLKNIFKDYWQIITRKAFLIFTLPFCFMFLSLICWVVQCPFILMESYHQSPIQYGLIQLYVFGGFIVGAQITTLLIHRVNPISLIKWGVSIGLLGALSFVITSFMLLPLYAMVISMIFVALGAAMTFGPLSRFAIEVCEEPMGRRMAIFSSYMNFFGVFSTLLVTLINVNTMKDLAAIVLGGMITSCLIFALGQSTITNIQPGL
ncbi:MAG: Bcr/CflA family efflux MFS transporter [Proteobacteria bacterium]|nr:Bcr/CflA family efflux MFS transporter [Pseudomonadota bacterium]